MCTYLTSRDRMRDNTVAEKFPYSVRLRATGKKKNKIKMNGSTLFGIGGGLLYKLPDPNFQGQTTPTYANKRTCFDTSFLPRNKVQWYY